MPASPPGQFISYLGFILTHSSDRTTVYKITDVVDCRRYSTQHSCGSLECISKVAPWIFFAICEQLKTFNIWIFLRCPQTCEILPESAGAVEIRIFHPYTNTRTLNTLLYITPMQFSFQFRLTVVHINTNTSRGREEWSGKFLQIRGGRLWKLRHCDHK